MITSPTVFSGYHQNLLSNALLAFENGSDEIVLTGIHARIFKIAFDNSRLSPREIATQAGLDKEDVDEWIKWIEKILRLLLAIVVAYRVIFSEEANGEEKVTLIKKSSAVRNNSLTDSLCKYAKKAAEEEAVRQIAKTTTRTVAHSTVAGMLAGGTAGAAFATGTAGVATAAMGVVAAPALAVTGTALAVGYGVKKLWDCIFS